MNLFGNSLAVEPLGGRGVSANMTLLGARGTLRDRFRGALLGLSLAPTALCVIEKNVVEAVSLKGSEKGSGKGSGEVVEGLDRSILGAIVPKLLRYHDSWERRRDWIVSGAIPLEGCAIALSETDQDAEQPAYCEPIVQVQMLMLGDFLEMALGGFDYPHPHVSDGLSGLAYLENRLSQYDLPTVQQRYYLTALAEIFPGQLSRKDLRRSSVSIFSSGAPSFSAPTAFVGAILCALRYPESYGLAVQAAAAWGELAVAIAGLLAGASGGQSALPVLWQLKHGLMSDGVGAGHDVNGSEVLAIADRLFGQWAGIAGAGIAGASTA